MWCRLCNCSLVDRTYSYCPEVFRTIPVCLKNGMAVSQRTLLLSTPFIVVLSKGHTTLCGLLMEAKPATFIIISVLREPPAARRGRPAQTCTP